MLNKNQNVRLNPHVLYAIEKAFHMHFLINDSLWLFGSRADLTKKGGDIDLYIETNINSTNDAAKRKIDFLSEIFKYVEEQKIDVVLNVLSLNYHLPIYDVAKKEGVKLI